MDNGKGKNKVDEYDQEQNYEDDFDICTLKQNPDIIGSSSSDNELPETGEKSMIAQPNEPLRQISRDFAVPCSPRDRRIQIRRSQRLTREVSGRQRMRETGSSSQGQFHHQLESGSGQQATQPGDNLIPPAPQLTTDFPSETYSPYLYANNCAWHYQKLRNKYVWDRLNSLDKRVSEQKHSKGRILKLETKMNNLNEFIDGLEDDNTEFRYRISMLEDVLKSLERKPANDDTGCNLATDQGKSIIDASPCTNVGNVLGARTSDPTNNVQDAGNEAENLERQGSLSGLDNADGPSGMLNQDDGL
ncbi:hypothetical protein SOVF_147700 isoform B, partial [Spinacia oleracea]